MAWDERHARRLTREVDRVLRPIEAWFTRSPGSSSDFFLHMEGLRAEKRAAYETRNLERYEAVLRAMVTSARWHLLAARPD